MKWIARILFSLVGLLVFILAAAFTLWMNPSLVLTDQRVNQLFDHYAGAYFSKRPEQLKLTLNPFGLTGKRVVLEASAFCLKDPDACFKEVHLEFAFKAIKLTKVRIEEVGPLEILNQYVHYEILPKSKSSEPESKSAHSLSDYVQLPMDLIVKNINLEFPELRLKNGKEIISGSVTLRGKESDQLDLAAQATSNEGLEGKLDLHTALLLDKPNPFQAKLHFKTTGSIDGSLSGMMDWHGRSGNLEGGLEVRNFVSWMNTLYVKNLKLTDQKGKIQLGADLETKFEQRLNFEHSKSVLPKASLGALLRGKLSAVEEKGQTRYTVEFGPVREKGLVVETKASGSFPFPKGQEYRYGIETFFFKAAIPVFQTFVQSFRKNNYTVPAPFSVLAGKVELKIGNESGEIEKDSIPIEFITDLDSKEQTLKTRSKATFTFAKPPEKLKLTGESQIETLKLTLPEIKVLEPAPLVKNDSRLVRHSAFLKETPTPAPAAKEKKEKEKEANSDLDLTWKISTNPSGIHILHPILKPYAPLEVAWTIGNDPSGSITVLPFEIEYLNRGAKVKSLRFYQTAGDPRFHYEGKLVVVKTDYTIFVDVIQDGDSPKVVLTSDPPLEQGDIISVLLFNQTSSELDTDQTSSVASTQSAVTSRALGLFSVLALSSTPVEAVNFNPTTGIYSARVKLANGLTATVGTDWDKTQEVALRKRLGKNFVLSTILQTDPETNEETRKTLIEWFRRF